MLRHPKKKTAETGSMPASSASTENTPVVETAGNDAPPNGSSETTAPQAPCPETTGADAAPNAVDPAALERELAAVKDRHLRLLADFENARKRQGREREETIRRANEELLHALLPVLDHLELALASPTLDADSPFVKGIRMVAEQFVAVLQKFDLKPIMALGQKFDPGQHEALTQLAAVGVPPGHVAQQLRRGWNLSGRLLRPAQVIVSTGAPEAAGGGVDQPVGNRPETPPN